MIIVTQKKDMLVNFEHTKIINIYNDGIYAKEGKPFCILAFYGDGDDDCVRLGVYATEERCKEILQEIRNEYGKYFYRQGGPAILRGSVDVPGEIWNVPKCYDMPEE